MKRFCLYTIVFFNVLLLFGCREEIIPPVNPEPQPRVEAERTVIIYMAADNSLSAAVRGDTIEMVRGKNLIPQDVNVVIFIDGGDNRSVIYELSAKEGMKPWKRYSEPLCSTDSLVMLNILQEIETNFPARHFGITFWSHASGWSPERQSSRQKTFGKDEHADTAALEKKEMEIPVLRDVLAQLPKFDYIFFDACFMQCIEVAYELKDLANYIVGSPAEIPGPGAPYYKVMEALCKGDAMGIVNGYDSGYPGEYYGFYYPGVLLSCIDCSKLDALAEATGQYLIPLYMNHTEWSPTGFQFYCTDLVKYNYFYDMRTTMRRLLPDEDFAAWDDIYNQAVRYSLSNTNKWYTNIILPQYAPNHHATVADPYSYGGVSMFVPLAVYSAYGWNEDFRKTSWYAATGWAETGW